MGNVNVPLTLENAVIKQVKETKFLGVLIDQHLSWKPHIDFVSKKISKSVGIIAKAQYQQHDFIIQAVVNGRKLFLDFACGYPGSMHDARVLRRSATVLGEQSEGKSFQPQPLTLTDTK